MNRTHATCPWGCARTRAAETVRPSEPLGRGLLRQERIPGRRAPDGRCRGRPVGKLEHEQVVDGGQLIEEAPLLMESRVRIGGLDMRKLRGLDVPAAMLAGAATRVARAPVP